MRPEEIRELREQLATATQYIQQLQALLGTIVNSEAHEQYQVLLSNEAHYKATLKNIAEYAPKTDRVTSPSQVRSIKAMARNALKG
jgi:hypothetical protein